MVESGFYREFSACSRRWGNEFDDAKGARQSDWARRELLIELGQSQSSQEFVETVTQLFRRGDLNEQQAILRALADLPKPQQFTELFRFAMRTNVEDVFKALCFDNAYPALFLDEEGWNQMILKALFLDLNLQKIPQAQKRMNSKLWFMVQDYVRERQLAGRSVPKSYALVRSWAGSEA